MKKIILILTMLMITMISAYGYTVEEKITENPVAKGVIHKNIKVFTTDGANCINLLRIDLDEPGLSLKILSEDESYKRNTVGEFVDKNENAVAAVNGDFFTVYNDGAAAEGMMIKEGEIITGPSNDKSYAVFGIDDEGNPFADYFTFEIKVRSERTGDMNGCLFYNKLAGPEYLKIYDRGFGKMSPGSMDDGYEVVVEEGVVTGIYSNKPGVEIPENGYVLHNSLRHSLFLSQNFQIGDEVSIEFTVTPETDEISEATGGGTLLLKNGKKTQLTIRDGKNPVTAAGFDKKNNILYLMTVDGRIKNSVGFTLGETADYLLSLGCTDGISFDGGGSTSMAIKRPDDEKSSYVNLSGGSRAVINSVGIFQKSHKKGKPAHIIFSAEKETVRENESVKLNLSLYDEYMNSLDIEKYGVEFEADKEGSFEERVFYPEERGFVNITAKVGNLEKTIEIYVAEELRENFTDEILKTPEKEGYTLSFFGDNGNLNTLYTDIVTTRRNNLAGGEDTAVFRQKPTGDIASEVLSLGRYSVRENENGAFIGINNSKGSINSTDSSQWEKLVSFMKTVKSDRVFIMLSSSYENHDEVEKKVLIRKIREYLYGKNIFIISYDKDYTFAYDDGIRFITIRDIPHLSKDNPFETLRNTKFGRFTITDEDISFEFVPYFELSEEESKTIDKSADL